MRLVRLAFHLSLAAVCFGIAICLNFFFQESFLAHRVAYITIWLFLPPLAAWVNSDVFVTRLVPQQLSLFRTAALALSCFLSLHIFASVSSIRDEIGARYVAGYTVIYPEGDEHYSADEEQNFEGNPYGVRWYARLGLQAFEFMAIGLCIAVPLSSWKLASRFESRDDNDKT